MELLVPKATCPCMAPGMSFSQPSSLCPNMKLVITALICGSDMKEESICKGPGLSE